MSEIYEPGLDGEHEGETTTEVLSDLPVYKLEFGVDNWDEPVTDSFKALDRNIHSTGISALDVANRARELALEARDAASATKELVEYTQRIVDQILESGVGGGIDDETVAQLLQRLTRLEDDVVLINFDLLMNGLSEGARNIFVEVIDSPTAVNIKAGLYANGKAYI